MWRIYFPKEITKKIETKILQKIVHIYFIMRIDFVRNELHKIQITFNNENFKSSYTNYNHEEFMLLPSDSTFSRCSLIQICFEFICSVIFLYVLSRSKDIRLCTFIHWDDKCAPFRCSKTCQGCHYQMHFKCFQQWFFCLHVNWLVYVLLGPFSFFFFI